jgi:NDP-sugar pyrophosphorylase family protein
MAAVLPALILAAGKGTRLGDLGRQVPKVLIPIGGRPLLDQHLEHLEREGIERVVINAHHLADQLIEHVALHRGPLEVEVLLEPTLLGTAGAAINALDALGEAFFVIYGDVMLFEPLAPLLSTHRTSGAIATLAVYEAESTRAKGVVEVDERGRVRSFVEQDPDRTGPGLVNAGLYLVTRELLMGCPPNTFLDFGHDVFPAALRAGHHLQTHLISSVLDIGTPEDLASARAVR